MGQHRVDVISGDWSIANNRMCFARNTFLGCKTLEVSEDVRFDEFVRKVLQDFGLDHQIYMVKLSFVSEEVMHALPENTSPTVVANEKQLRGFVLQPRREPRSLCAEFSRISPTSEANPTTAPPSGTVDNSSYPPVGSFTPGGADEEEDEEDAVGERRFDCCDDDDGASSDDEDFTRLYKKFAALETNGQPSKEGDPESADSHIDLEKPGLGIAVGQVYPTKSELETRLKEYAVIHRFDFDVVASSTRLLVVKCWVDRCTWRVRATTLHTGNPCFYIRKFNTVHSCTVTERSARSRQASPDILGSLYLNHIGGVGPTVTPRHVADSLNKRLGLKVPYWKAHRALLEARAIVAGTAENSFADLPSYLYRIRRANPGTVTKLEVDGEQRFKYLFFAFSASIRGFPYMRKVVVVDGTFLQGRYKGTLLTATMQDGNFQIFPMAFGVVDNETDESWEWFFSQLSRVIPDDRDLAIISDRHISIANAIRKVYPRASRGVCTYHLRQNILSKFKGGDRFKLFKKAATAYRLHDFAAILIEIEKVDARLFEYLMKADVRLWSRAHFPGNRYNFTTSNIAESINNALAEARSFPIVHLVDAVRAMLTRWFASRRANAQAVTTILTLAVEKLLKKRIMDATQYVVQDIDEHQASVTRASSTHVVNLTEKKCSCKRFDVDKIPCVHAVAVADAWKRSKVHLTNPYYYTSYLYNGYANNVMPRDAAFEVPPEVAAKVCKPPLVRNQPGRPRKTRIRSWFESSTQPKRPRKISACSKCGGEKHNSRTCKGH